MFHKTYSKENNMNFTVGRHGLKIILDSNQDKAFVEDTLKIKKEGDYVLLVPDFIGGTDSIYALVTKSANSDNKKTNDNLLGLALGELRSIIGELPCTLNPPDAPPCGTCVACKY
jgi:hypothetical protein